MKNARIFLTDYASYNNGTQFEFGHWVDLDQFSGASELMEYISSHFEEADEKSPIDEFTTREEIMITDFEGFPKEFYSECMDFESLYEFFEAVENCYLDYEVIEAYASYGAYDIENVAEFFEKMEEAYQGQYNSDAKFAEAFAEEIGAVDQNASWPNSYIDWEWAARDLMMDYFESDGHYFRSDV